MVADAVVVAVLVMGFIAFLAVGDLLLRLLGYDE